MISPLTPLARSLVGLLAVAGFTLGPAGCASDNKAGTPAAASTAEKKAEHPKAEHPKSDHPK